MIISKETIYLTMGVLTILEFVVAQILHKKNIHPPFL